MTGILQKWGNSVALRIPKTALQDAELEEGMKVKIKVHLGSIVVEQDRNQAFTLDELLSGVTKRNLHEEQIRDEPTGKELW